MLTAPVDVVLVDGMSLVPDVDVDVLVVVAAVNMVLVVDEACTHTVEGAAVDMRVVATVDIVVDEVPVDVLMAGYSGVRGACVCTVLAVNGACADMVAVEGACVNALDAHTEVLVIVVGASVMEVAVIDQACVDLAVYGASVNVVDMMGKGASVGFIIYGNGVAASVGVTDGALDGTLDGLSVGVPVGLAVGLEVGACDGTPVDGVGTRPLVELLVEDDGVSVTVVLLLPGSSATIIDVAAVDMVAGASTGTGTNGGIGTDMGALVGPDVGETVGNESSITVGCGVRRDPSVLYLMRALASAGPSNTACTSYAEKNNKV